MKIGSVATKALRWAAVNTISVFSPAQKIVVGDTTYYISRTDDYISRELQQDEGYHSKRLSNAIQLLRQRSSFQPGGVILNLGAHVGTTLIPAFQSGLFRQGLGVEPAPENAKLLEKNLAVNGLADRIKIAHLAIGEEVGQGVLYLSRTNSGNHTFLEDRLVWDPFRPKVTVQVTTLDRLLNDFEVAPNDVSAVIMDIQGFEHQAFAGGHSLFSQSPPLIMEMDHNFIETQEKLRTLCQDVGQHYERFHDLDDPQLTSRPIDSLEQYFGAFSGYRDMFLV